ncbi:MAG: LysR family transcriptional regulator [Clostridia bacterium]|nr:LysR family transcriptional regulator [Clostridia bacterium]MBQ4575648.1 LysR family transcriptional regulator [Clostridia bacterium]
MNTLYLKYAVEVEKTKSITQAAKNLFMAQPNLSKAIRELEDTLGFAIFERASRGVTPTPKGSAFLRYAKNILVQLELMESLYSPGHAEGGRFELDMPAAPYIKAALRAFFGHFRGEQGLDARVTVCSPDDVIARVSARQSRLGILRYPEQNEPRVQAALAEGGLRCDVILSFTHQVLMSRGNPLADADFVSMEELSSCTRILGPEPVRLASDPAEGEENSFLSEGECRISYPDSAAAFELLSTLEDAYMWSSPMTDGELKNRALVQKSCSEEAVIWRDALIYARGTTFSEAETAFIDRLYEAKKEIAYK